MSKLKKLNMPNYMCPRGVYNLSSPSGSKSKDKENKKVEDTTSDDFEHQTRVSPIFL
jgi:hypothetical protein